MSQQRLFVLALIFIENEIVEKYIDVTNLVKYFATYKVY